MPNTSAHPLGRADLAWLLPPLLVGAALRLWNAPAQILAGDEMHAVRVALVTPLSQILTTYELRDNCIPLTALYRVLLEMGLPLSELVVRLPMLLAGLAALVVFPWVAAHRLGRKVGHLFAWLVALSPLCMLYSRIARPYEILVLFGFVATAAFEAWWGTGDRRLAGVYVVGAALTVWFHLGTAPFLLAPFVFALGSVVVQRRWKSTPERPGLLPLLAVAAATALAMLGLIFPAHRSLLALVAAKHEQLALTGGTLAGILRLQSGAIYAVATGLFWLAALYGAAALLRGPREGWAERPLGLYSLILVAAQVAGLVVLSPEMLAHPLVFDRYLLPVLPWVLLWVAVGLAAPWWPRQSNVGAFRQAIAALAVPAALFVAGPLVQAGFLSSSFTGHNDFVGFFCPRAQLSGSQTAAVPGFYRQIVRQERGAAVLEYPWIPLWSYHRVYYLYQEVHHRDVLVAMVEPLRRASKLAFRNMPFTSPEGFLASRARYLVVHTDLLAEEEKVQGHCWPLILDLKPRHRTMLQNAGARMAESLTKIWGEADYKEPGLYAWDLARLRRAGAQAGGGGK